MDKRSTKINIDSSEYTITGYETEEYMQRVGIYVDKKMQEVRQKCFTLDKSTAAVLTAVNIANENIKLSDRVEDLIKEKDKLLKKIERIEKIDDPSKPKSSTGSTRKNR